MNSSKDGLSAYLNSNSIFHRMWSDAQSGPHSFPCSAWDNIVISGHTFMHIFAHGLFPKNWNLTTYKDTDD